VEKMVSQRDMLKEHFERKESITGVEAAAVYKIRSLPRRIMDLKEEGYEFTHEWKKDVTGQKYMRYILVKSPTLSKV
jgi:hypothetical protein